MMINGADGQARCAILSGRPPLSLWLLLVASLVVPPGFLGGVAWYDRHRFFGEAYGDITGLSAIA